MQMGGAEHGHDHHGHENHHNHDHDSHDHDDHDNHDDEGIHLTQEQIQTMQITFGDFQLQNTNGGHTRY